MWLPALPCVALLCVLASHAHAHEPKRAEISPMPFVLGSRYGRSEPRMLAPRNDRFFMGSRYGKRSESPLPLHLPLATPTLLCEFTGVATLYHCETTATDTDTDRGHGGGGHNRKTDDSTVDGTEED